MSELLRGVVLLLRPRQWVKNGFVLLPLFFGHKLMEYDLLVNSIIAFLVFSCMSSAIYCFNDIEDLEFDKMHPKKCDRPLASGVISLNLGWLLFVFLAVFACMSAYIVNQGLFVIMLIYLILNLFYTLKLKQFAIIDVFIIAVGFVLRVYAGSVVTNIALSEWIILMTFLLALFLGFAKRRDDVLIYEKTNVQSRRNTSQYNMIFLNSVLSIITAVIIVAYMMYCMSDEVVIHMGSRKVYFTSVFVILGLFRYLQQTFINEQTGSPTQVLFTDHFLQLILMGWILTFTFIIYV
ncbi:UbiA prenyltransferase family protein [uncultured Parabacteroides sp.]|uniref:UbiA prenyltransferase family protein n=1 Tax=uncultured Parabacteroides sp. TaxID=512312 RepID=UPI0025CC74B5|nr:UbiA prenyltransferase family protein [uncultured Parabacteroides sp.]